MAAACSWGGRIWQHVLLYVVALRCCGQTVGKYLTSSLVLHFFAAAWMKVESILQALCSCIVAVRSTKNGYIVEWLNKQRIASSILIPPTIQHSCYSPSAPNRKNINLCSDGERHINLNYWFHNSPSWKQLEGEKTNSAILIWSFPKMGVPPVNPDVWIQLLTAIHSESLSESWHEPPFTSAYSPRSVDK